MKSADHKAKLDELLKLPAETEWVEFKEARSNLDSDDLGKYFVALCNEANLKGESAGWLVLGVQDKPRKVVLEALNNCIAHQDYSRQARIIVVEKTDRLIFENAGSFFEGSLEDYLFRDRIPRHYRNRLLAEAMVSLDMIDALTGDKAQYIRNRAFDDAHYKKMILDYLAEYGSASRADVDRLLKGKLSDVLTPQQQVVKVKNLLAATSRKDKTIVNHGSKKKPEWRARK